MKRSEFIANRLKEVLLDGRWIANTNYKDQLQNLSWTQATHKIGSFNTIAVLTYHINYYLAGLLYAFDHGILEIKDKYSFDMPPINSAQDWGKLFNEFLSNAEKFVEKIEKMPDEILDENFIEAKYGTYLRNIEGVIEHSYYHLGQISLIKKWVLENEG